MVQKRVTHNEVKALGVTFRCPGCARAFIVTAAQAEEADREFEAREGRPTSTETEDTFCGPCYEATFGVNGNEAWT